MPKISCASRKFEEKHLRSCNRQAVLEQKITGRCLSRAQMTTGRLFYNWQTLSAYLQAIGSDFRHGVNFATIGATAVYQLNQFNNINAMRMTSSLLLVTL
ncbi:hypothetical protein O6H91_Y033200 [Diphasiastrum complanatum]|nr:hypothetical protein O6H91_Y033200 [Diphasiastrum complanatum]